MSSNESSPATTKHSKRKNPRAARSPSASEIARNVKNFEIWTMYQCCEQVSYSDVSHDMRADVDGIFDVTGCLPLAWTDEASREYERLSRFSTPAFMKFIKNAYKQCPTLFGDKAGDSSSNIPGLYAEISIVFSAWQRLRWMRKSKEKWSEADYVANVYNVFRSPAIKESAQRAHCTISLPQPIFRGNMSAVEARILNTKTAIPDCAILLSAVTIRSLSLSAKSPFKVLKGHSTVIQSGSTSKGSSFRYQSTPCATLPDTPCFEFASSFWEDKKPVHNLLEDAYRQNRMSTASALRHLHSLSINSPVFGLVWSSGIVRAHVDWWKVGKDMIPTIFSAPYPGASGEDIFYEWQLDQPSDILAVYFLIRNLDRWTNSNFHTRVTEGVKDLVSKIVNKGEKYTPWKRVGELKHLPLADVAYKENATISATSTVESSQSTPPKSMPNRRRGPTHLM